MLVGTHDPEQATSGSSPYRDRAIARRMRLGGLDRVASEQLLRSRLPVLPAGHKGFDQVFWRTRGLPAFIVEIARLAERSGDSLAAVEQALEGVMPESVRASLTLRLERLDRADLQLMRAAAVAGQSFAESLLRKAGLVTVRNLDRRLQRLEHRHHLIRQESEGRYRFQEPQVREFLLTTLPPDTRRELHRALATYLMPRRAETPPEVLARHLLGAGRDAEAGRFLRAAAESALSVFAEEEALRLADLAERGVPPGARGEARRRDVHLIRARALESLGRYEEALAQAMQAARLARGSASRAALGEALVVLGEMQQAVGDTSRAERTLRQAEGHCLAGRRVAGQARALLHRGHVRYQQGRHAAAAAFYRKAVGKASRGRDPVLTAKCRANLSNVLAAKGEFEAAAEGYLEAIEFHRACGDRRTTATLEGNLGLLRLKQGRLDEGRSLMAESLRVRREIGDRRGVTAMELRLARCGLALGDPALALSHATRAEELARAVGEPRLACHAGLVKAECALVRGAVARAEKRLATLQDASERFGGALAVHALELLMLASLRKGDVEAAASHVRKARRKVARLGNPAYASIVDRRQARLLLARGRPRDVLRLLGLDSEKEDVESRMERFLLVATAARRIGGRDAETHGALAEEQTDRFETLSSRIAQGIADPAERKRYLAGWRRERRAVERLGPA
jgi:tetratricopeptide (TPR) repeat protein